MAFFDTVRHVDPLIFRQLAVLATRLAQFAAQSASISKERAQLLREACLDVEEKLNDLHSDYLGNFRKYRDLLQTQGFTPRLQDTIENDFAEIVHRRFRMQHDYQSLVTYKTKMARTSEFDQLATAIARYLLEDDWLSGDRLKRFVHFENPFYDRFRVSVNSGDELLTLLDIFTDELQKRYEAVMHRLRDLRALLLP